MFILTNGKPHSNLPLDVNIPKCLPLPWLNSHSPSHMSNASHTTQIFQSFVLSRRASATKAATMSLVSPDASHKLMSSRWSSVTAARILPSSVSGAWLPQAQPSILGRPPLDAQPPPLPLQLDRGGALLPPPPPLPLQLERGGALLPPASPHCPPTTFTSRIEGRQLQSPRSPAAIPEAQSSDPDKCAVRSLLAGPPPGTSTVEEVFPVARSPLQLNGTSTSPARRRRPSASEMPSLWQSSSPIPRSSLSKSAAQQTPHPSTGVPPGPLMGGVELNEASSEGKVKGALSALFSALSTSAPSSPLELFRLLRSG